MKKNCPSREKIPLGIYRPPSKKKMKRFDHIKKNPTQKYGDYTENQI